MERNFNPRVAWQGMIPLRWWLLLFRLLATTSSYSFPSARRAYDAVSPEEVSAFRRDGVAVVRGVLTAPDLALLREECDQATREPSAVAQDLTSPDYVVESEHGEHGYFTDTMRSDFRPRLMDWVERGAVAAVAGRLTGSRTERFLQDQFFVKPPGERGGDTVWHQDVSYCAVKGKNVVSVFVALDDISDPRECLRFVPGSGAFCGDVPGREVPLPNEDVAAAMRNAEGAAAPSLSLPEELRGSVGWSLRAGDCVGFTGTTVHGGPGGWGRALTMRFIGEDVEWCARDGMFSHVVFPSSSAANDDDDDDDDDGDSDDNTEMEANDEDEGSSSAFLEECTLVDELPEEGIWRGDGVPPLFPVVWDEEQMLRTAVEVVDPRTALLVGEEVVSEGLPPPLARSPEVAERVAAIVNAAYTRGEEGMWAAGAAERTSAEEVRELLATNKLLLAVEVEGLEESEQDDGGVGAAGGGIQLVASASDVIGVVLCDVDFGVVAGEDGQQQREGEIGMLAVAESHLGDGVGRSLVAAAERSCREAGCAFARLELLEPRDWAHPFKRRLRGWYEGRLGYAPQREADFQKDYPRIAPLLACPCTYTVFQKCLL